MSMYMYMYVYMTYDAIVYAVRKKSLYVTIQTKTNHIVLGFDLRYEQNKS